MADDHFRHRTIRISVCFFEICSDFGNLIGSVRGSLRRNAVTIPRGLGVLNARGPITRLSKCFLEFLDGGSHGSVGPRVYLGFLGPWPPITSEQTLDGPPRRG